MGSGYYSWVFFRTGYPHGESEYDVRGENGCDGGRVLCEEEHRGPSQHQGRHAQNEDQDDAVTFEWLT